MAYMKLEHLTQVFNINIQVQKGCRKLAFAFLGNIFYAKIRKYSHNFHYVSALHLSVEVGQSASQV